jgi:hypothetical protein
MADDERTREEVAGTLQLAAAYVRSSARTQDWFVGYSVAEAVRERITEIGESGTKETTVGTGASRRLTRLAQLDALENAVAQAAEEAKKLP